MKYVDGFLIAVPKKNLKAYTKMAELGARVWKKHGALDYKECVGDDMNPNMAGMKTASFPGAMKLKPTEVLIFSFIVFKSRAHRDSVNKKVMNDPLMSPDAFKDTPMPFDMKRMAYGGFSTIVDTK